MIDLDTLRAVRAIVVHNECADGLASAILLHDALPLAEISFLDYGTTAHERLEARTGMMFCDFSPPRARAAEFVSAGAIVLDHHKTMRDVVLGFGDRGVFGDEQLDKGVSGAVLAHRHVWLPLRESSPARPFAEWFASVAGVRDTWQRTSAHWHDGAIQEHVLLLFPREFWLDMPFEDIALAWHSRFAWVGDALLARARERVERAVDTSYRFVTRSGARVVVFEGIELASDAADFAKDTADVVVAFGLAIEVDTPVLRLSLRSETTFDCGAFASRFGGGGHTRAAGFSLALGAKDIQPFAFLEHLFTSAL